MTQALAYVPAVLEAHLDQGAFLWLQWYGERFGETPGSDHGASLRTRLLPHLEGCLLQPEASWGLYQERCDMRLAEAGEHFLGACLALHCAKVDWVKAVAGQLADCESLMALHDAMTLLAPSLVEPWARRFAAAGNATLRALGKVWLDPAWPDREALDLARMDAHLQEFLCLAVHPPSAIHQTLAPLLDQMPPDQRYRIGRHLLNGAESSTATKALLPLTLTPSSYRDELIRRGYRNLDQASAKTWIQRLKPTPESLRATLLAVGALGEQALLPWVVQQLSHPPLARVAGWALEQILELNLEERGWVRPEPAIEADFLDDPRDLDRPWPDVEAITAYVYQRRASAQARSGTGE